MNDNYRFDFVFSYWIFAWFILYYLKVINYSPLFALVIGFIYNIFLYIYLIYVYKNDKTKYNFYVLFDFVIVNFFIKVLPIYYLLFIQKNKITINNILQTFILFTFYLLWIIINKKIYIENYKLVIVKKSSTPFYNLFYYWYNNLY